MAERFERLLVLEVKDGWAPLCAFLGLPVPDEPFPGRTTRPRSNDGSGRP
ncbi:sulfotransferase [Actinomadura vinacea]